MNTLYVEIGQLYPRADFAGVLINLNVDKAIDRGKSALISSYITKQDKLWADTLGPIETYTFLPSNAIKLNITSIYLPLTFMKSQNNTGCLAQENLILGLAIRPTLGPPTDTNVESTSISNSTSIKP